MTARILLLAALCAAGCLGCAAPAVYIPAGAVWTSSSEVYIPAARAYSSRAESAAPAAITLTWTMPTRKANGDTLSTAPLDWQMSYAHQSQTWRDHQYHMRYNPDTLAFYWAQVVIEAAPIVVASGVASPGAHVEWAAIPVTAGHWPFSWRVRSRQRPSGEWGPWSNPVTRADNQ